MVLNAANRILPKEARLRPQDKRRWLGGSLLRPGSAERLGEQLGGYAAVQRILRLVSILLPDGSVFRQELVVARHREGAVSRERTRQ